MNNDTKKRIIENFKQLKALGIETEDFGEQFATFGIKLSNNVKNKIADTGSNLSKMLKKSNVDKFNFIQKNIGGKDGRQLDVVQIRLKKDLTLSFLSIKYEMTNSDFEYFYNSDFSLDEMSKELLQLTDELLIKFINVHQERLFELFEEQERKEKLKKFMKNTFDTNSKKTKRKNNVEVR